MAIYAKSSLSKKKPKYLFNNLSTLQKDNIPPQVGGKLPKKVYFFGI
jgi:hypothetical protein